LKAFVALHFATPREHFEVYERRPNRRVSDYINDMWQVLRREPDEIEPYSSLLPLGRPYIVPGGRFREIYYWDSYFTMLGLEQDDQHALARDMLQNFASLIDRYGHVPNGNRSGVVKVTGFTDALDDTPARKRRPTRQVRATPPMQSSVSACKPAG
jgi:alpha,alpha-trehalase